MWIRSKVSQQSTYDYGDGRTAVVGHTNGKWYWYIAAIHRIFANPQEWLAKASLTSCFKGGETVKIYDGPPATSEEWRGTAAKYVANERIAKREAIKHLKENP